MPPLLLEGAPVWVLLGVLVCLLVACLLVVAVVYHQVRRPPQPNFASAIWRGRLGSRRGYQ